MASLVRIFVAVLLTQASVVASAERPHVVNISQRCMLEFLRIDGRVRGGAKVKAFSVPSGALHGAIETFLGEAILTHSVKNQALILGLGGAVEVITLAEGLRLALETASALLEEENGSLSEMEVVYFGAVEDVRYLERVATENGVAFRYVSLNDQVVLTKLEEACANR